MQYSIEVLRHFKNEKKSWIRKLGAALSSKTTDPVRMREANKRAVADKETPSFDEADIANTAKESDRLIDHLIDQEPTIQQSVDFIAKSVAEEHM